MVKKEPVSVLWQSIFMIIPLLDLYAAYRVEKLRKYLLFIISFSIVAVILSLLLFPTEDESLTSFELEKKIEGAEGFGWAIELISIGIAIILIRKWSREWNEQFSENSITGETK